MKELYIIFESYEDLFRVQQRYFLSNFINQGMILFSKSSTKKSLTFVSEDCREFDTLLGINRQCTRVDISDFNSKIYFPYFLDTDFFVKNYKLFFQGVVSLIQESDYWDLDTEHKRYLIGELLCTVADQHTDGVSHGYLSFYSNYLYYLSQLRAIADKKSYQKIKKRIEFVSDLDRGHFKEELVTFPKLSKNLGMVNKELVKNVEKLDLRQLPSPYDFFKNSKVHLEYSEFHKNVFSNPLLLKRYSDIHFVSYRIIMGFFFKVLPLLGISLNERNHILYLFVRHVEEYFNVDWKKQINESIKWEECNVNPKR